MPFYTYKNIHIYCCKCRTKVLGPFNSYLRGYLFVMHATHSLILYIHAHIGFVRSPFFFHISSRYFALSILLVLSPLSSVLVCAPILCKKREQFSRDKIHNVMQLSENVKYIKESHRREIASHSVDHLCDL